MVMGTVGFIEERGRLNLGLGIPAGGATVLAAGESEPAPLRVLEGSAVGRGGERIPLFTPRSLAHTWCFSPCNKRHRYLDFLHCKDVVESCTVRADVFMKSS